MEGGRQVERERHSAKVIGWTGDVGFPGQPYNVSYDYKLHVGLHFCFSSSAVMNAFEE